MFSRRGVEDTSVVLEHVLFLVLLVVFVMSIFLFVQQQKQGAGVWEDWYVRQVVDVVHRAKIGDTIVLDVHEATSIAQKNGVDDLTKIFWFDVEQHEACARFSQGQGTCYPYVHDVAVAWSLNLADDGIRNRLHIMLGEPHG